MKNKKILISAVMAAVITIGASAEEPYCVSGSCAESYWSEDIGTFTECTGQTCDCTLSNGRTTTYQCGCTVDSECGRFNNQGCIDNICEPCVECSNCVSTNWTSYRTSYQSMTERECNCDGTCESFVEYRCAAGYYGTPSNGTSGCSQCPEWTGVYTNAARTTVARGTSSAGATAVSGCSVPTGKYYDVTGTFDLTKTCAAG